MNEQQLQQILTIQQAFAAAATAVVINNLLNPQQAAAGLADTTASDIQQQLQQNHHHHHQQQQHSQPPQAQLDSRQSPSASVSPTTQIDPSNRIQELLLQLQQQAAAASGVASHTGQAVGVQHSAASASPISRLQGQPEISQPAAGSNVQKSNHLSSAKKLKRHHQSASQQFSHQNRSSLDATSKHQESHQLTPKSHSTIASLPNRNNSNSSAGFLANNVGLPRKLVRGQDVWLGRGAEQTRQILKCMWCGQSFRTLAEMSQHMRVTQHYTNIISQEQITSWRQPDNSDSNKPLGKQSTNTRNSEDNRDDSSEKFNDSDRDESISSEDQQQSPAKSKSSRDKSERSQTSLVKEESTPYQEQESACKDLSLQSELSASKFASTKSLPQNSNLTAKPLTRSRKREHEDQPTSYTSSMFEDKGARENSPASSSPNQRQNSKINVLSDLNENSEANKDIKSMDGEVSESATDAGKSGDEQGNEPDDLTKNTLERRAEEEQRVSSGHKSPVDEASLNKNTNEKDPPEIGENTDSDDVDAGEVGGKLKTDSEQEDDEHDEEGEDNDIQCDTSNKHGDSATTNEQTAITTPGATKSSAAPGADQKTGGGGSDATGTGTGTGLGIGDPLSALETMVEKSFDPRLRPGLANGGILQRLGIDEEVCPPWQHLNYTNWHAAALNNPMTAALIAAGFNPLNGFRLPKNLMPRRNDE